MATNQTVEPSLFTWGDVVQVTKAAPMSLRPGDLASIVGITPPHENGAALDTEGEYTYTIEYGDGTDSEVAQSLLVLVERT